MIELHNALYGELAGADLSPLGGLVKMAPNKVVALPADQVFAHGESAEGIGLTTSKKAVGTGTNGLMYAEDEYLRNPEPNGKAYSPIRRAYVIAAMRAARAGKKCGLYNLPYVHIEHEQFGNDIVSLNDTVHDLIQSCEVALPDIYLPAWDWIDEAFYERNVPLCLAEACRIPNALGIPTMPFIQLWTTNAERNLTDRELAAIAPRKLEAAGCAGAVLWGWSPVGTPKVLDRLNDCIRRAAKVWAA